LKAFWQILQSDLTGHFLNLKRHSAFFCGQKLEIWQKQVILYAEYFNNLNQRGNYG